MKYIKNSLLIIVVVFMLVLPVLSLAQNGTGVDLGGPGRTGTDLSDKTIINPIGSKNLTDLVKTILEGVLKIGIPVIALAIIYSGFLFVSAQGNPEKISDARRSLLYTLIGAAILLGSWGIAQLITETVRAL